MGTQLDHARRQMLTAARAAGRRKEYVALVLAGVLLGLPNVTGLAAQQPGCSYTLAIYCGGHIYCTTSVGNSCVTCKR